MCVCVCVCVCVCSQWSQKHVTPRLPSTSTCPGIWGTRTATTKSSASTWDRLFFSSHLNSLTDLILDPNALRVSRYLWVLDLRTAGGYFINQTMNWIMNKVVCGFTVNKHNRLLQRDFNAANINRWHLGNPSLPYYWSDITGSPYIDIIIIINISSVRLLLMLSLQASRAASYFRSTEVRPGGGSGFYVFHQYPAITCQPQLSPNTVIHTQTHTHTVQTHE